MIIRNDGSVEICPLDYVGFGILAWGLRVPKKKKKVAKKKKKGVKKE